jgi:protein SCO1/2
LIDKKSRIRGMYDGTNTAEVKKLIEDVKLLKQETY